MYDLARVRVGRCRSLGSWNLLVLGVWLATPEYRLGIGDSLDLFLSQHVCIDCG